MRNEGRDVNPEQVTLHVVHPGLHQDYDLDFQMWRVDDIAPTLTSPLLSGLISNIRLLGGARGTQRTCLSQDRRGPVGSQWSFLLGQMHQAPHASAGRHLMCERPKWRLKGTSCVSREGIDLAQTLPGLNPEDVATVIISDDYETDFPIDTPQAASILKVEPAWNQKRPLEDSSPCSSPPKRATEEKEESPPPCEAVLPRGVMEEDALPKRYETFTSDNDWVQCIRCSLLGLEAGTMPPEGTLTPQATSYPEQRRPSQTFLR